MFQKKKNEKEKKLYHISHLLYSIEVDTFMPITLNSNHKIISSKIPFSIDINEKMVIFILFVVVVTSKIKVYISGFNNVSGVVYHDLKTLRRVYFARAALAVRAK